MGAPGGAEQRTPFVLDVRDETAARVQRVPLTGASASEYDAVSDFRGNGNAVPVDLLKLESQGWDRDAAPDAPSEEVFGRR